MCRINKIINLSPTYHLPYFLSFLFLWTEPSQSNFNFDCHTLNYTLPYYYIEKHMV
ncbi:hypothetical protein HanPSC8_Chr03g0093381 [Helianthus annuus]|nr:hypothetical protein HanIR_Chr03g0105741 [Helianthus annuus]KAJ0942558.1 hypothetical protein HanPSC8_Chr03g0093381 [Helianthus annuus]